jgi:hypothetical protein
MADLGRADTDVFTLSLNYDVEKSRSVPLDQGLFGLATRDAGGNWINAVDKNTGGARKFVLGAWNPSYRLGAYGIDTATRTVWAVINYNGDFAVGEFKQK